jgi:hypothetical protein
MNLTYFRTVRPNGWFVLSRSILTLVVGVALAACGGGTSVEETAPARSPTAPQDEATAKGRQATPTAETEEADMTTPMRITSSAFQEGETIPTRYTCDGDDDSPDLQWSNVPASTQSFAMIMDDPDAPGTTWTHWVLFDISPEARGIEEEGSAGMVGSNNAKKVGYSGPCPPSGHGPHRYFFTLYALDIPSLNLSEGAAREEVQAAMEDHVLAEAQVMGRYERE